MIKICLFLFLAFLFTPQNSFSLTDEEINYRYSIASTTGDLLAIRKIFGEILQSGDLNYSFEASKDVITTLDKIGKELDSLVVPKKMEDPYNVFLEAVKSYRKSATCIRNSTEILLGYFDGTEEDAASLMKRSTDYVELANKYFDLSFDLHSEVFDKEKKEDFPKGFDKDKDFKNPEEDSEKLSI